MPHTRSPPVLIVDDLPFHPRAGHPHEIRIGAIDRIGERRFVGFGERPKRRTQHADYFDVRLQARLREEAAKPAVGWMQWLRRPALALALTVLVGAGVLLVSKKSSVVTPGAINGSANNVAQVQTQTPAQTQTPDVSQPGTAVGDLQALDNNDDLYADFDVLDDVRVQEDVTANP